MVAVSEQTVILLLVQRQLVLLFPRNFTGVCIPFFGQVYLRVIIYFLCFHLHKDDFQDDYEARERLVSMLKGQLTTTTSQLKDQEKIIKKFQEKIENIEEVRRLCKVCSHSQ